MNKLTFLKDDYLSLYFRNNTRITKFTRFCGNIRSFFNKVLYKDQITERNSNNRQITRSILRHKGGGRETKI